MKLITETIEDVQVLTEEKNGRKDYKIKAKYNNDIWHLFSENCYQINDSICIDYNKSDLIYFDNMCESFFK